MRWLYLCQEISLAISPFTHFRLPLKQIDFLFFYFAESLKNYIFNQEFNIVKQNLYQKVAIGRIKGKVSPLFYIKPKHLQSKLQRHLKKYSVKTMITFEEKCRVHKKLSLNHFFNVSVFAFSGSFYWHWRFSVDMEVAVIFPLVFLVRLQFAMKLHYMMHFLCFNKSEPHWKDFLQW